MPEDLVVYFVPWWLRGTHISGARGSITSRRAHSGKKYKPAKVCRIGLRQRWPISSTIRC